MASRSHKRKTATKVEEIPAPFQVQNLVVLSPSDIEEDLQALRTAAPKAASDKNSKKRRLVQLLPMVEIRSLVPLRNREIDYDLKLMRTTPVPTGHWPGIVKSADVTTRIDTKHSRQKGLAPPAQTKTPEPLTIYRSQDVEFKPGKVLRIHKGRTYLASAVCMHGKPQEYKVGDHVFLFSPSDKQWISKIETIFGDQNGELFIRGRWFYRSEETKITDTAGCLPSEVFESTHVDQNKACTIAGKCSVVSHEEYLRNPKPTTLFCRRRYNVDSNQFEPL